MRFMAIDRVSCASGLRAPSEMPGATRRLRISTIGLTVTRDRSPFSPPRHVIADSERAPGSAGPMSTPAVRATTAMAPAERSTAREVLRCVGSHAWSRSMASERWTATKARTDAAKTAAHTISSWPEPRTEQNTKIAVVAATASAVARRRWAAQSPNQAANHSASPAANWNPGSTSVGAMTTGYCSRATRSESAAASHVAVVGIPRKVVEGNRITPAATAAPPMARSTTIGAGARSRRLAMATAWAPSTNARSCPRKLQPM